MAGASINDNELERRVEKYLQPDTQEGVYRYMYVFIKYKLISINFSLFRYGKVQQKRFELECTLGIRNN